MNDTPTSLRLPPALLARVDALASSLHMLPEGAALTTPRRADVLRAALAVGVAELERRVAERKEAEA